MKKLKFFHSAMVALALTAAFASCSNDDNEDQAPVPEEQIPVAPVVHYDLTVTVDKHGGMGRDVTTIMQSRERLDAGDVVNFENIGAEINADYTMEAITRGKYYYQVPNSEDRFVKLQFKDNKMHVVQAQPFKENTYNKRQYTHTWLNDNTLIIMAANGNKNAIVWTKLKTDDMTIISEGTLDLALEGDWDSFTTSGILAYRQNDNKLFYFYYMKKGTGRKATKETNFRVAVINAETMAVEQKSQCPFAAEMAGSAYGELLQQTTFSDEQGNLYLAAFSDTEIGEEGKLLRIKVGEYNIDADYNGFPNSDGKLLTTQYLGNGKVFCYSRHDDKANLGTDIDSYAHYYSVVDMNANTRTRMSFGGTEIPYSSGRFSQRSAFNSKENKVYFGVNIQTSQPQIYVYDVATGNVTEGVKVAEGYYFEQIRIMED